MFALIDLRYAARPHLPYCIFVTLQVRNSAWHASIQHLHGKHFLLCDTLISSCFSNCMEYVLYAVSVLQDAAHWLMDQENLERSETGWYARQEQLQQDAEQAARQEKASRKQLLDKYHLQAVPTSMRADVQARSVQAPKSKVLPLCHCYDRSSKADVLSAVRQVIMQYL